MLELFGWKIELVWLEDTRTGLVGQNARNGLVGRCQNQFGWKIELFWLEDTRTGLVG